MPPIAFLPDARRSGLMLAILAGALVNARIVIYSASLAARWSNQPTWFRLVAAPLIIDSHS